MKLTTVVVGLACGLASGALLAADASLKTDEQRLGYALGLQSAQQLRQVGVQAKDVDAAAFADGVRDALDGKNLKMNNQEIGASFDTYDKKLKARMADQGAKNKKAGDEYLAKNKSKKGVTTLSSGMQYRVIASGKGPSPKPEEKVRVHYRGTLVDGTEFDSSTKHGKPVDFQINRVIRGWQEILPLMKEGDKWEVTIPSEMAYGHNGPPGIGPDQTLIFEIELLKINPT